MPTNSRIKTKVDSFNDEELAEQLSNLFKVFSSDTRIRILTFLLNGEANVETIANTLSLSQSAVSHQLVILKNGYLIKDRKDGQQRIYSIIDDHVKHIIEIGSNHVQEKKSVK